MPRCGTLRARPSGQGARLGGPEARCGPSKPGRGASRCRPRASRCRPRASGCRPRASGRRPRASEPRPRASKPPPGASEPPPGASWGPAAGRTTFEKHRTTLGKGGTTPSKARGEPSEALDHLCLSTGPHVSNPRTTCIEPPDPMCRSAGPTSRRGGPHVFKRGGELRKHPRGGVDAPDHASEGAARSSEAEFRGSDATGRAACRYPPLGGPPRAAPRQGPARNHAPRDVLDARERASKPSAARTTPCSARPPGWRRTRGGSWP
jgi:hypothetical protein